MQYIFFHHICNNQVFQNTWPSEALGCVRNNNYRSYTVLTSEPDYPQLSCTWIEYQGTEEVESPKNKTNNSFYFLIIATFEMRLEE